MTDKRNASIFIWMAAIALAVVAGGYFLVIRPMDQKRQTVLQNAADKQLAAATLGHAIAAPGEDPAKADAVRAALANFELKLPQSGETDKVLENVWHLAQANSLQMKTTKTPAEQTVAGYREQQLELSLSGDFAGIYQFLLQLEDSKHVVRIEKLHLTRPREADRQVQADITIAVLFEPPGTS